MDNPQAVGHLLRVLTIFYDRMQLSALFSMQCIRGKDLKRTLDTSESPVAPNLQKIILKYVVPGDVTSYLMEIEKKTDPELGKKAGAVLREIGQYSGVNVEGQELSGLPVV